MKNRILFTIFISLFLLGMVLSVIFSYYISTEKIQLIDYQLKETANTLIRTNISKLNIYDANNTDERINKEIGQNRIGKLFFIYDNKDQILFQSKAALLTKTIFPTSPTSYTKYLNNKTYRVLNLKQPDGRIIQIALILDTENFEFKFILRKLFIYALFITLPVYLISYYLANFMFTPIVDLANYLKQVGVELESKGEVPIQPNYFNKYRELKNKDEFSILIGEVDSFIEKLKIYNKVSKPWSYRLAHELKTPLAYVSLELNELEQNLQEKDLNSTKSIKKNLNKVSELISSFLAWSTSENTFTSTELYIVNVQNAIQEIVTDLNVFNKDRIRVNFKSDFNLICNPLHFNTLCVNLLSNSIKYSEGKILITLESYSMTISDEGPGLPESIKRNLGQPFNSKSTQKENKGNGLGIAWVITICNHYFWESQFINKDNGFYVSIDFSKNKFGLDI